jgi:hypothetical protein
MKYAIKINNRYLGIDKGDGTKNNNFQKIGTYSYHEEIADATHFENFADANVWASQICRLKRNEFGGFEEVYDAQVVEVLLN